MDASAVTPASLREKAARYRNMVLMVTDHRIIEALVSLAQEYDALADRLESAESEPRTDR